MSDVTTTTIAPTLTPDSQLVLPSDIEIAAFDSSAEDQRFRIELADGRHFQINERLYNLLDLLHTPTKMADLADRFFQNTSYQISMEQLTTLCTQLLEQNLIKIDGQPTAPTKPVTPKAYLGMHFRRTVLRTEWLAPLARLFRGFFHWPVAIPMIILFVVSHVLAYRELNMQSEINFELFAGPLLTGFLLFSVLLHELGHVAACHRFNCPHGPLGFGLYFSMPIFYVDVTQAWRLTRRQRAIVDVGGVYLQMLCVPLAMLLYWWSGNETYLIVILTIDMVVLYNFEPFFKLDGYWLLSDLVGVANLHTRTQEAALHTGKRLWRRVTGKGDMPTMSAFGQWPKWVQTIIWGYLILSAVVWPLFMVFWIPTMWQAMTAYPALVGNAVVTLITAAGQGDILEVLTQLVGLIMPTLILVGVGFELKRLSGRLVTTLKNRYPRLNSKQPAVVGA